MTTSTTSGVRCGNHPERTYHATLEEVRSCHRSAKHSTYLDRVASEPEYREPDLSVFDRPIPAPCAKMLQEATLPVDSDGMYRNPTTGQIFKVYHTVHGANQLVAKELIILPEAQWYNKISRGKEITVKAEFEYRGKAGLRGLTGNMKRSGVVGAIGHEAHPIIADDFPRRGSNHRDIDKCHGTKSFSRAAIVKTATTSPRRTSASIRSASSGRSTALAATLTSCIRKRSKWRSR